MKIAEPLFDFTPACSFDQFLREVKESQALVDFHIGLGFTNFRIETGACSMGGGVCTLVADREEDAVERKQREDCEHISAIQEKTNEEERLRKRSEILR